MREFWGAIVGIAVGAILAAGSVIFSKSLPEWRVVFWIGCVVAVVAALPWLWLLWRAKDKDKATLSLSGPHLFGILDLRMRTVGA